MGHVGQRRQVGPKGLCPFCTVTINGGRGSIGLWCGEIVIERERDSDVGVRANLPGPAPLRYVLTVCVCLVWPPPLAPGADVWGVCCLEPQHWVRRRGWGWATIRSLSQPEMSAFPRSAGCAGRDKEAFPRLQAGNTHQRVWPGRSHGRIK